MATTQDLDLNLSELGLDLRAPARVQFHKKVGGMGFHGIERDEKFIGDLLVGEPLGYQFQHFVFAFADAEPLKFRLIEFEIRAGDDDFFARELHARPNADHSEENGHSAEVKLQRKIANEVSVFDEFQDSSQRRHGDAIEENGIPHTNT